jgi:hypothetical protein
MHVPLTSEPAEPASDALEASARAAPDLVAALWQALRARRVLVALVAGLGLLVSIVYLRTATYEYVAQLRVAAAPGSASRAPQLGSLSGLAALAGVGLEAEATPFRLYLEDLHSPLTAAELARDAALMQKIFAEEWDGARWQPRPSLSDRARALLLRLSGAPVSAAQPPDAARLQAWLARHIVISEAPKSPVVTLMMAHPDPAFAKAMLERVHQVADDRARARALARASGNIAHLDRRLEEVSAFDHRQAMFVTRAAEEQRLMLAKNPTPFATQRFGSATATSAPVSPRQGRALIIGLALGLVAGVLLALALGPVGRRYRLRS